MPCIVLTRLDNFTGRLVEGEDVDNSGFFKIDQIEDQTTWTDGRMLFRFSEKPRNLWCKMMFMGRDIPTHAVKAVITNEHGDILFLRRDGKARADGKSNWDLPGGLVEDGEDNIAALKREIEEELKRKAEIGQELGKWAFFRPFDGKTVEVTNYAVTLVTDNLNEFALSDEHTAAKFVARTALSELDVKDPSIFEALSE